MCPVCLGKHVVFQLAVLSMIMKRRIALQVSDESRVFNMDGKKVGSVSADEYGEEPVAIYEDGFVYQGQGM